MHIKQIIIQGFKSYKNQTVTEPFSPKHNVIVGRNGSGKSNFFSAIRFVLGDAFTSLQREERQSLLHEGAGSAVMSAYVEITFDNSDDRFHTGKEELILRRTIGQKKDEYSLDRRNATKTDVMNLLESAGFSKSNPYYIVPQGRVTTLTNMKDTERLVLLKTVAGTQVYEARRVDSLRIMDDTDSKRGKIDELLDYITERLSELEEDKKELQDYRDKDRERRCLEYTIWHREQDEYNRALEEIEQKRGTGQEETEDNRERFVEGEKVLTKIDSQIQGLKQQMDLLKLDRKQYEEERRDVARQRAKIEFDVNQMTEGQDAADSARHHRQMDTKTVNGAITDRDGELTKVLPKYEQARKQEDAAKAQADEAESKRQRLYAKQGRNAKFKSKSERDGWLQKEISDVMELLAVRKASSMQTNEDLAALQTDVKDADAEVQRVRGELDNYGNNTDSVAADVQKAKEARDGLLDQRKELWREQARLSSVMSNTESEMSKCERFLSSMMDQNTSRGIAAVRRIAQQQKLDGVYGTVGELFTVHDRFKTAVEVTAGNSLFHYVVDTDETATKITDILYKNSLGRVTFMPLNRLHPRPANLPKANDALSMISKLSFDPMYEKAMSQIFGHTIISPNLQVAAQYARSHGVNGITPEGDRSDSKGALTGGHYDVTNSRLDGLKKVMKMREEHDTQKARYEEINREVERLEQEVTRSLNELNKGERRHQQAEGSYLPLQQELRSRNDELQAKKASLEQKRKAKANVDANLQELSAQQAGYEQEKNSEFKKALTSAEESQLDQLTSSIPDLRRKVVAASEKRSELEGQKSTLETELEENLRPRLDALKAQEQESGSSGASGNVKILQRELKTLNGKVQVAEAKLKEVEESLEKANGKVSELQQSHAEQKGQQEQIARAIEKQQKRSEKSIARRALLTEKLAEVAKSIRGLGGLPDEAYGPRYAKVHSSKALQRLATLREALRKYSHVNKKAFEQYTSFTNRQETLTDRRTELDSSQTAIRELITVLDQRKDEAIERTFKQVSKEFASIFERLVPAGRGRLIIQRRNDRERVVEEEEDGSDDERNDARRRKESVENYTGVGISVSFNSKHDEQQRIQQLSGGQKSLCALALVFAIQQCDPAPFYLFDEIDANLDAQYRTAVAQLLKEISGSGNGDDGEGAQFICTTFRPEMVHVAEKCYGVAFLADKSSSVEGVGKERALEFVESTIGGGGQ